MASWDSSSSAVTAINNGKGEILGNFQIREIIINWSERMNAIITARVYSPRWGYSILSALTEQINADNYFGGPAHTHISTSGQEVFWFTAASLVVTRFGNPCPCLAAIYH